MHFQIIEKGNNCGKTDAIRQFLAIEICFLLIYHIYFTQITQTPLPIRLKPCARDSLCVCAKTEGSIHCIFN